jgi:hypothetical protein
MRVRRTPVHPLGCLSQPSRPGPLRPQIRPACHALAGPGTQRVTRPGRIDGLNVRLADQHPAEPSGLRAQRGRSPPAWPWCRSQHPRPRHWRGAASAARRSAGSPPGPLRPCPVQRSRQQWAERRPPHDHWRKGRGTASPCRLGGAPRRPPPGNRRLRLVQPCAHPVRARCSAPQPGAVTAPEMIFLGRRRGSRPDGLCQIREPASAG